MSNPGERWGIVVSRRDGYPALTETSLWHLLAHHPETVERVSATELYVHLDQPYRAVSLPDRDFRMLVPAPGRPPPAHGAPR
jgi:hypothetical protein